MFIIAPSHHVPSTSGYPGGFFVTPAAMAAHFGAGAVAAAAADGSNISNGNQKPCGATASGDDETTKNPSSVTGNCKSKSTAATAATPAKSISCTVAQKRNHVVSERSPVHHNETDKVATISIDVTGYTVDDMKISFDDHVVSVHGERTNRLGDTYVIHRRFKLDKDTADEDKIQVRLIDGVLDIIVPKKAVVGPRVIPITTTARTSAVVPQASPSVVLSVIEEEKHTARKVESEDQTDDDDDGNGTHDDDDVEVIKTFREEEVQSSKHESESNEEVAWENVTEHV